MKRRIRAAIVGVSAIILLALGVPLAIAVHRSVIDQEVVELQAVTATALAEIEVPITRAQLRHIAREPDAPATFAVYAVSGHRIYGQGPARADKVVRQALSGETKSTSEDAIVVATPILAPGSETVTGALRVYETRSGAERRAVAWYAAMVAAGLAAIGLAWIIGNRLAKTLASPLSSLAEHAAAIGDGAVSVDEPVSGIAEVDSLASVLSDRTRSVNEAIHRERQFSADVSHQLRTPITALRLKLEQANSDGKLTGALRDVDRVEATIEHLLAIARGATPTAQELRLDKAVAGVVAEWQPRAEERNRRIDFSDTGPMTVRVNTATVGEVLNVLLDNALRHGAGAVRVALREVPGGVAVDVADEGTSISALDAERVFERGHGAGSGIGLAVARAVAEAEGARLVLGSHRPTTFSLLLLA